MKQYDAIDWQAFSQKKNIEEIVKNTRDDHQLRLTATIEIALSVISIGADNTLIHDAIEAGFNKVVFIIRKDIEGEFKKIIGDRIASICAEHSVSVSYAFQDIHNIPGDFPEGRTKPWGTGQAVLAAKELLDTPFVVINADDYYGKQRAYVQIQK